MAVQGILAGFCDPEDRSKNVILFGRGSRYDLVLDGQVASSEVEDLYEAQSRFRRSVETYPGDYAEWVSVTGTREGAFGPLEVTQVGYGLLRDWVKHYLP